MSTSYEPTEPRGGNRLNVGKLWAGGVATAVVAALIGVMGVLVARSLFGIAIIAPAPRAGLWQVASAAWYAVAAVAGSLVATALMQILIAFTPRPIRFFTWVMVLATAGAALAPLAVEAGVWVKLVTSLLNLIIGVAIGTLVAGTARGAIQPVGWPIAGPPYPTRDVR